MISVLLLTLLLHSILTTTLAKHGKDRTLTLLNLRNPQFEETDNKNKDNSKKKNKKSKDKKKGKKKRKKKGNKKKKKKKKTPTESPTTTPTKSNVKVLVTFNNLTAMIEAKTNLTMWITAEHPSWSFWAIEASSTVVEFLEQSSFVDQVDIDHDMENTTLPVKPNGNNSRRQLEEEIPWGISAVLQDVEFFNNLDVAGPKKVCVADTGHGCGHSDLPLSPDVTGEDGTGDVNETWDFDGSYHGTHCAGTVAAIGNNTEGVVGVIPDNKGGNFQLLVGKALDSSGSGTASALMAAVQGCVDQGANVVSMSLGCSSCWTRTESTFYKGLYEDNNILLVAAAGNDGNDDKLYPASYKYVMSVAAMTESYERSWFSQYNDQVEIAAPGSSIKSTTPGDTYATWDGTSMATPHVAAVAGLLWMHFPDCANYQIRNVLNKSAKDIDSDGCDTNMGHGLVQAKDAYDLLAQGDCGGDIGYDHEDPQGGCDQLFDE